ncbi:quinolinate synthase A [Salinimicrobium marinum]|uniref:Quinolinate synthase n=1 Tax=Salinimicrobium marinum TaxID=680283 RepID=A0A918SE59_9FLAO|nr:quinolinate synthase NadA [Salinimicrobium marinum]GHA34492.1 quinolinate synthase A [Salinimicrobium marinum]
MNTITTDNKSLQQRLKALKEEKNAVILAHYYQEPDIQEVADFIGDSLELAKKAAQTSADIIVFAGVHFMAETAKILNPSKKVLLPDLNAGCSLAESCPPDAFQNIKSEYPDHVVVTYINCSAEIKAMSDLVCTSSNAEKIINSIPEEKEIIFAPDKNLGRYLIEKTGRNMLLWDGACIVHEAFSLDKLLELYKEHPSAMIIAHPESEDHILKTANYIGSTSGMLNFVKNSDHDTFIVATEAGILHQMQKDVPHKTLIPAPAKEDNTCACSECAFMKMNTLQKLYNCLEKETPEILLEESLMKKAHLPIQRMLEI